MASVYNPSGLPVTWVVGQDDGDGWPRPPGEKYPWGDSIPWPPGADLDD